MVTKYTEGACPHSKNEGDTNALFWALYNRALNFGYRHSWAIVIAESITKGHWEMLGNVPTPARDFAHRSLSNGEQVGYLAPNKDKVVTVRPGKYLMGTRLFSGDTTNWAPLVAQLMASDGSEDDGLMFARTPEEFREVYTGYYKHAKGSPKSMVLSRSELMERETGRTPGNRYPIVRFTAPATPNPEVWELSNYIDICLKKDEENVHLGLINESGELEFSDFDIDNSDWDSICIPLYVRNPSPMGSCMRHSNLRQRLEDDSYRHPAELYALEKEGRLRLAYMKDSTESFVVARALVREDTMEFGRVYANTDTQDRTFRDAMRGRGYTENGYNLLVGLEFPLLELKHMSSSILAPYFDGTVSVPRLDGEDDEFFTVEAGESYTLFDITCGYISRRALMGYRYCQNCDELYTSDQLESDGLCPDCRESRWVCDRCGDVHFGDISTLVNVGPDRSPIVICEDCIDNYYHCTECEEYFSQDEYDTGRDLCNACSRALLDTTCDIYGRECRSSDEHNQANIRDLSEHDHVCTECYEEYYYDNKCYKCGVRHFEELPAYGFQWSAFKEQVCAKCAMTALIPCDICGEHFIADTGYLKCFQVHHAVCCSCKELPEYMADVTLCPELRLYVPNETCLGCGWYKACQPHDPERNPNASTNALRSTHTTNELIGIVFAGSLPRPNSRARMLLDRYDELSAARMRARRVTEQGLTIVESV